MFSQLIEGFIKDKAQNIIMDTIGLPQEKAPDALHDVIGSIFGGMKKNAEQPGGTASLLNALDKDHDGSILDDLAEIAQSDNKGQAILGHILGDKQGLVEQVIGAKNGLDSSTVSSLLKLAAPIVLGFLGKKQSESNRSPKDLEGLLATETKQLRQDPKENILLSVLDKDGDGDVDVNDIISMIT